MTESFTPKLPHPHRIGCCYDYGWCGPHSVIAGLRRMRTEYRIRLAAHIDDGVPLEPPTETFLVVDHHEDGNQLHWMLTIGLERFQEGTKFKQMGNPAWRYCGSNDDPMGPGSHMLGCDFKEIEEAIAQLCFDLGRAEEVAHRKTGRRIMIFREYERPEPIRKAG